MGVLLQARTDAGDEDIPTRRVNLMRPSAALLRLEFGDLRIEFPSGNIRELKPKLWPS